MVEVQEVMAMFLIIVTYYPVNFGLSPHLHSS